MIWKIPNLCRSTASIYDEESVLRTLAECKLHVAADRQHWKVIGPFGECLSDKLNLASIKEAFEDYLPGKNRWQIVDSGCGSYLIGNPEDEQVIDQIDAVLFDIENQGILDESAYSEAVGEMIDEHWASMSLSDRIHALMHGCGNDIGLALEREVPGDACEYIEEMLQEAGQL